MKGSAAVPVGPPQATGCLLCNGKHPGVSCVKMNMTSDANSSVVEFHLSMPRSLPKKAVRFRLVVNGVDSIDITLERLEKVMK